MGDGILIVDANALSKRHVGTLNRLALAFHNVGAFVIFVECIRPYPSLAAQNKMRRFGFNFDDIIQLQSEDYTTYDFRVLEFIERTLDNNSEDVVVITGSGMLFQQLSKRGVGVLLHD